jgi:hypothetical protein
MDMNAPIVPVLVLTHHVDDGVFRLAPRFVTDVEGRARQARAAAGGCSADWNSRGVCPDN